MSIAVRRIKKEYIALRQTDFSEGVFARPLESNLLHCHFLLFGKIFHDTPFEGGVYHGVLQFPKEYPMKPPSVIMRTPSGRFETDRKICMSMSDFHPELWNPLWSVKTILVGLVSFMNADENTTGGITGKDVPEAQPSHRAHLARQSLATLRKDKLAVEIFADLLDLLDAERQATTTWPPPRPIEPPSPPSPPSSPSPPPATPAAPPPVTPEDPEEAAKRAAKNKKKREAAKRKKAAASSSPTSSSPTSSSSSFLATLHSTAPAFLAALVAALPLPVSDYECDHVCYRTSSASEYASIMAELQNSSCTLLIESEIGGRQIASFALDPPIQSPTGHTVGTLELPSPKPGRAYESGLEHAEFVIPADPRCTSPSSAEFDHESALLQFAAKNSLLNFDRKALNKDVNADLSITVDLTAADFGMCSVKFHLMPLPQVIEWEKLHLSPSPPLLGWEERVAADIARKAESGLVMVAIAGMPGSGKSTSAETLAIEIRKILKPPFDVVVLPMDGYHMYLKELDQKQTYERGAPHTFDNNKLTNDMVRIKLTAEEEVAIPGFDHVKGDPVEGEHTFVRSKHRVVLLEGLYLLVEEFVQDPSVFDLKVYIDADLDKCIEALKVRNLCIPGYTKEEIEKRCDAVDRQNATHVLASKGRADTVVDGFNM